MPFVSRVPVVQVAVAEDPFCIDNGQLEGVSPEEAFTLGVEFAEYKHSMERSKGRFSFVCSAKNASRLVAFARAHERYSSVEVIDEHWSKIVTRAIGKAPKGKDS